MALAISAMVTSGGGNVLEFLFIIYFRTCLVGGFLFLFSKQYENNFQKIEIYTSF